MLNVKKNSPVILFSAALLALAIGHTIATPSFAEKTVMVGGAEM
jgi:hypothetical protein